MRGNTSRSKYGNGARILAAILAIMMLSSIFVLIAVAVSMAA